MKKELNDAQVNKVDNVKEDEKNETPDVAFGFRATNALINAFNETMNERSRINIGDALSGLGGAASAFVWKLMKDYEPSVRYSAMSEVARNLFKASYEKIFDDIEE